MSSLGKVNLEWWGPGTVPAAPSIVWCNFPKVEALGTPGPKARPALVFKSRYADDPPADRFLVLVAYGTSNMKAHRERRDFTLGNETMLNMLRLPQMTRFDLDRVLWLPWAKPFFVAREDGIKFATPTLAALPPEIQRLLGWRMAEREQAGLNKAYHSAPAPVSVPPSKED